MMQLVVLPLKMFILIVIFLVCCRAVQDVLQIVAIYKKEKK